MGIVYKKIEKEHYNDIKRLICEAFFFDKYIKNEKILSQVLNAYIQGCILSSSYGKVACQEDKVIGVILANAHNDKNKLKTYNNIISALKSYFKIIITKNGRKSYKTFSKIQKVYNSFIKDKKKYFQGSIELFIVDKKQRGHGIGKKLFNDAKKYMIKYDVKNLYLYTDTNCNYGFYDANGFKRLSSKNIFIPELKDNLSIYFYSYKIC